MDARFQHITAIGFDWDGTLIDSVMVKAEAFADSIFELYAEHSDLQPENHYLRPWIIRLYLDTCGYPRIKQLGLVQSALDKFVLPQLTSEQVQTWSDNFTASYINKDLSIFPQACETLQALQQNGYRLFLGSSVPQRDLHETLLRYPEVARYFDEILGVRGADATFCKGLPYLRYIAQTWNMPFRHIAFVGDTVADVYTTKQAGSIAVAIPDWRISSREQCIRDECPDLVVRSLSELLEFFPGVA